MRAVVQVATVLLLSLGFGCATHVEVDFEERVDFTRYATWSWLPREGSSVHAPDHDPRRLDALLARLVERELGRRGLRRVSGPADLLVDYDLRIRREFVTVYETGAGQTVHSLHDSPSYEIRRTERKSYLHETGRLEISFWERGGGRVWQGRLERSARGTFTPRLEAAVSNLLGRFPPAPPPPAEMR